MSLPRFALYWICHLIRPTYGKSSVAPENVHTVHLLFSHHLDVGENTGPASSLDLEAAAELSEPSWESH